jgi:type IV pilus assembly protein PilM
MIKSSALLPNSTVNNQEASEEQEAPTAPAEATDQRHEEQESAPKERRGPRGFSLFSRETLCLSIEGNSIRITVTRGQSITGWLSAPIDSRMLRNGYVSDTHAMGGAITAALQEGGIKGGSVIYAIPGFQTITRVIDVPRGVGRNLDELVEREARRLMPYSAENNHLFWQRLPAVRGQERVYAVTVPREPLAAITEAIQYAGLKPKAADVRPLALARAVNQANAIVAHGENNSFAVIVVVDGVPTLIRSTFLGDHPMDLESVATRLADELVRTISYYNDTNQEHPLDQSLPINITGEIAALPSTAEQIGLVIGRPVVLPKAPLKSPAELPLPQFMVNVGLALKKL